MRVIELIFVLLAILAHLATNVNSKVVRNRIWVEARAPVISQHNRGSHHGHRRHHSRPITQAYTSSKMTIQEHHHKKPTPQTLLEAVRPHITHTKLEDSFSGNNEYSQDSNYDYQESEYNDLTPKSAPSSLNTREAETENEYSDGVCRPERVRICEHCLKITRAPSAYEQCCTDQDNAFSWCRRIYHFSQSNGKR